MKIVTIHMEDSDVEELMLVLEELDESGILYGGFSVMVEDAS